MNVTEELADWEDSRNMNRKRQWFTIDEALEQLALHKPVQRRYLQQLKNSRINMTTSPPSTETALNLTNQIPESSSSLTEMQTTDKTDAIQADRVDADVAAAASITNSIAAANALAAEQSATSLTSTIQQSTSTAAAAI